MLNLNESDAVFLRCNIQQKTAFLRENTAGAEAPTVKTRCLRMRWTAAYAGQLHRPARADTRAERS